jgi:hypothetical protein
MAAIRGHTSLGTRFESVSASGPRSHRGVEAEHNWMASSGAADGRFLRGSAATHGQHLPRSVAKRGSCDELLGFRADGRNRSTVVGGAGPAARILNLSPNATNGAIRATRREAGATGFDCGAGGAAGTGAVAL